jgi:8-oxo-dGTP diphosphatase
MVIRVVACVIEREGRLLLCQRPAHKRHGGLWEFPGGKMEPGETPLEAAQRELGEEIAVEVTAVADVEFAMLDPGSSFRIEFFPTTAVGDPQCIEHARVEWIREDDLLSLPLAPSDLAYAHFRLNGRPASAAGPEDA